MQRQASVFLRGKSKHILTSAHATTPTSDGGGLPDQVLFAGEINGRAQRATAS
jgi:hypothetical protein